MSNWFTDLLAPFYYTDAEAESFAKNAKLAWDNLKRQAASMSSSEYADLYSKIAKVYGLPGANDQATLENARAAYNRAVSAGVAQGFADAPDAIRKAADRAGKSIWDMIPAWVLWIGFGALALWVLSIVGNFATVSALNARARERATPAK